MVATIIQIASAAVLAVGVGLVYAPAGFVVAGLLGLLFGIAMERNK